MNLIQNLKCVETPAGYILTWAIAEGAQVVRTTLYGLNQAREFVINSPLVSTGRFLLAPTNYPLLTAFKVSVTCSDGEVETTGPIVPQKLLKAERLLLKDMRYRFDVYNKANPIGDYPVKVLLRRIDGKPCPKCGTGMCSARGGTDVSDYCPICLGIGIEDPYYVYPEIQHIHPESPREDNEQLGDNPEVNRSHIVRAFISMFDLGFKVNDVFISGTEVYRILDQKIMNSVGNVPATYQLTAIKYAPEDPRYPAFMQLSERGVSK